MRTLSIFLLAAIFAFFSASCSDSQESSMKTLHDKNLDFDVSAFQIAAEKGDLDNVKLYLEAGMNPDATDESKLTPLSRAAAGGHQAVVEYLVEKGADVNVADPTKRTPLMNAADSGHDKVVGYLLRSKANPTAKDADQWTALTLAAFEGHSHAVELLAPKTPDDLNKSLLMASLGGHTSAMDTLLTHGAYMNCRSSDNQTPLMLAAAGGHLEAVKLLLHHKANRFAVNDDGFTAANLAETEGHQKIQMLLAEPPDSSLLVDLTDGSVEMSAPVEGQVEVNPNQSAKDQSAKEDGTAIVAAGAGVVPAHELAFATSGEGDIDESQMVEPVLSGAPGTRVKSSGSIRRLTTPPRLNGARIQVAEYEKQGFQAPVKPEEPVYKRAPVDDDPVAVSVVGPDTNEIAKQVELHDYREKYLPVILSDVNDGVADVRLLYGNQGMVQLSPGQQIPHTNLKVVEVKRQFASAKQGKGKKVNVSRVLLQDTETGEKHLLIKDLPATSSDAFAVMKFPDSGEAFAVRERDEFVTEGQEETRFRVVDVRPTQVVVMDVDTEQSFTIPRTPPNRRR